MENPSDREAQIIAKGNHVTADEQERRRPRQPSSGKEARSQCCCPPCFRAAASRSPRPSRRCPAEEAMTEIPGDVVQEDRAGQRRTTIRSSGGSSVPSASKQQQHRVRCPGWATPYRMPARASAEETSPAPLYGSAWDGASMLASAQTISAAREYVEGRRPAPAPPSGRRTRPRAPGRQTGRR